MQQPIPNLTLSGKKGTGYLLLSTTTDPAIAPGAPAVPANVQPAKLPLRVLVVDDDPTCRAVLHSILRAAGGIDVTEAEDGQRAWDILSGGQWFDLCFLDINMPNMDGLSLLSLIRRHQHLRRMRICMCSVVRDRDVIMQAASFRPDYYVLKPYTRETIEAEVQRTRQCRRDELDPVDKVCTRLDIDPSRYHQLLTSLFQDLRTAMGNIPDLVFRFDFASATNSLDGPCTAAKTLGAHQLEKLIRELVKLIDETQSGVALRRRQPASVHQWLADSCQMIIELINSIRRELQTIERLVMQAEQVFQENQESIAPTDSEFNALEREIIGALRQGKVIAPTRSARSKSLKIPIRASLLGEDPAAIQGGLTRRTSFTLAVVNEEVLDQFEIYRTTADLVRRLSFHLKAGVRWMPTAAVTLLSREIAWRNEQAAVLVRKEIGGDLEIFLQRQAEIIRTNLQALGQSAPADEQIAQVVADIRGRLSVIGEGAIAAVPVTVDFDPADLPARGDALWTILATFIAEPAQLIRQTLVDRSLLDNFDYHTFDLPAFTRAMDVFGDSLVAKPDVGRAAEELRRIQAMDPATSARERCQLLWRMIKRS